MKMPAHPKNKKENDFTKRRIRGVLFIFILLIVFFVVELFNTAIRKNQYYLALAKNQQIITTNISPMRGSIYASDDLENSKVALLAHSVERFALSVTPKNIPKSSYQKLAAIFDEYIDDKSQEDLIKTFSKNSMYTPPIKHGLTKSQVEAIANKINPKLKLNFDKEVGDIIYFTQGVLFIREYMRMYPEESLASHTLGFVDQEGTGQYGIEGFDDAELKGSGGSIALERDNAGALLDEIGQIEKHNGEDIVLTIDRNVQHFVEDKLAQAMETYKSEFGQIIVMDPKTGAIIAMSGKPDFNPNDFKKTEIKNFLNPILNSQYEPGSAMKPFTVSAALDLGLVEPSTKNNYPSSITIGSYTISNVADKSYPDADITSILDNSINTGATWLADKVGNKLLHDYLTNFGFGQKTGLNLPGEITGDLPDWQKWRDINRATISFGQGDAVTPIQLTSAYTVFANKGVLMKPHIIKEVMLPNNKIKKTEPQVVRQVISEKTAETVKEMLQHVVEFGHAKRAAVDNYQIGGKTGTAQIPLPDGSYSEDITNQTFVGLDSSPDPRFVVSVILHKPNTKFADGSTVYIFHDIAKFLLNYWQIPPSNTDDH